MHCYFTSMDNSSMVLKVVTPLNRSSTSSSKGTKNTESSIQSGESTSSSENANTSDMQVIRKFFTSRGRFRKKLQKSYYDPGEEVHTNDTPLT